MKMSTPVLQKPELVNISLYVGKWFLQSKTRTYFVHDFFLSDGSEISASTLMDILLMNDFKLVINKITYDVQCPKKGKRHS